jgi:hypothetical protein
MNGVVAPTAGLDDDTDFGEDVEGFSVQELSAPPCVETLDAAVRPGPARGDQAVLAPTAAACDNTSAQKKAHAEVASANKIDPIFQRPVGASWPPSRRSPTVERRRMGCRPSRCRRGLVAGAVGYFADPFGLP